MRNQDAGKSTFTTMVVLAALASLTLVATHGDAKACGGLFCNARPVDPFAPLPVAQNGENVVFSITKDPAGGAPTLQAHIQILYTGDAAKFSWVVPVDAQPTLSTGTDRLFAQLGSVTAPRFTTTNALDGNCIPPPGSGGRGGSTGAAGFFGTDSAGTTGAGGSAGGGVNVLSQGAVGPFETAVLQSTDPTALKKWLTDNSYIISDQASGLIDVYVSENKFFVALKLLNGVGVRQIQPIVLTFRGTEACVPLRLTAIAANPDMPVLVWVLGDKRVVPRGYYEIKVDEARVDWLRQGSNYFGAQGLVSLAANEAGGNAFVTEYAGPSSVGRALVYQNGTINLTSLMMSMTPPVYVQQVMSMGLANDSLMLPLLEKYIPMPDAVKMMNITSSQFYQNISFYWQQFAFPPYDLAGLTQAISDSIVTPRINAQMMIDSHPYLTRLNTFISPEEMNKDPFFFETRDLGAVSNVHTAVIRTMCGDMEYMACNAPQRLELADGRMAWIRAGSKSTTSCNAPAPSVAALSSLPAAEIAWAREETGDGMTVLDKRAVIASGIAFNNANYPDEQMRFPIATGAAGSAGTGGKGGSMGAGGTGGGGGGVTGSGIAGTTGSGTGGATGGSSGGDAVTGIGGTGPGTGGMQGGLGEGGTTAGTTGGPVGSGGGPEPDPVGVSNGGGCGCATGGSGAGTLALALAAVCGLALSRRRRSRR